MEGCVRHGLKGHKIWVWRCEGTRHECKWYKTWTQGEQDMDANDVKGCKGARQGYRRCKTWI